jgi:Cu+-exporting ATPase
MAAKIDRLVLDKTGTLTEGQMSVAQVVATEGWQGDDLLRLGAAVEQYSNHPIATAIVSQAGEDLPTASQFKQHGGLGATARVGDDDQSLMRIGSAGFVEAPEKGPLAHSAAEHQQQGQTVVWLSKDEQVLGFIALQDKPKPEARETLARLRQLEIVPVMLSGDNPQTTQAIASQLELDEYEGSCPPEEKSDRIRDWQKQGEKVAMVGDGINDAPALAEADLSITVAGGTDVAGETSDVILTRADLRLLPWLIEQSHRTRRIIMENLGWAFAYNLVSVPLAAFGLIKPVIAAAAMATSSLIVVGNSLRLRR